MIWPEPQAVHRLVCKTRPPNLSAIIHFSSLTDYLYRLCIQSSRTTTYAAIWRAHPSLSDVKRPDLCDLCKDKMRRKFSFNYTDKSIIQEKSFVLHFNFSVIISSHSKDSEMRIKNLNSFRKDATNTAASLSWAFPLSIFKPPQLCSQFVLEKRKELNS